MVKCDDLTCVQFDFTSMNDRFEILEMIPFIEVVSFVADTPRFAVVLATNDREWKQVLQALLDLEDRYAITVLAHNRKEVENGHSADDSRAD